MNSVRLFFKRGKNWLAFLLVVVFIGMAITAPLLSPIDPESQTPGRRQGKTNPNPTPPSDVEPLGTLPWGVSVYHQIIWGSRTALTYGLGVTAVISVVGTLIGALSAYWGSWPGHILVWLTDSFLAFPVIAAVVLIDQVVKFIWVKLYGATVFGGSDLLALPGQLTEQMNSTPLKFFQIIPPLAITFVLFLWMPYAKIMHTSVLQKKQQEYILSAKVSGVKTWRIIWRHLLPNTIGPVIVMAAKDVGAIVVLQSAFTFAQLSHDGSPWSNILITGKDYLYSPNGLVSYWWLFFPATIAIVLFGVAWNLLGDGINEAINPYLEK
jgi:peptide/nickel transport system permease protein